MNEKTIGGLVVTFIVFLVIDLYALGPLVSSVMDDAISNSPNGVYTALYQAIKLLLILPLTELYILSAIITITAKRSGF